MLKPILKRPLSIWIVAIVGCVFGLASIRSGGSVLFIDGPFRESVGIFIPFVVWFNFLFGFVYFAAGVGLWVQRRWAVWISLLVVIATLIVFTILVIYIVNGGTYELRTIYAMILRFVVWVLITIVGYIRIIKQGLIDICNIPLTIQMNREEPVICRFNWYLPE